MARSALNRLTIKDSIPACLLGVCLLGSSAAQAASLTVNASDDIYAAGSQSALVTSDGVGTLPVAISGISGSSYLTFSATGSATLNNYNYNDPDGVGAAPSTSSNSGYGSLSGISAPGAGYLVGVFVGSGGPSGAAPASLDYTGAGAESQLSYSPLLDQVFFIGDGLTGDGTGTTQQFYVPNGATAFYLGISDACGYNGGAGCYGDNFGSFTVNYNAVAGGNGLSTVPLPGTALLFGSGLIGLLGLGRKRLQRRAPVCAA